MRRSTKISAVMHKLLIEKGMDVFSVVELRDAYLRSSEHDVDPDEARKMIYRQILRFTNNNWLTSEGKGQNKKYYQTNLFKSLQLQSKPAKAEQKMPSTLDYSVLRREHGQYKAELEIILGEVEEYQSLSRRFPELEGRLSPLLEQAKERSAQLLGKVNVLTNVLKTLTEDSLC